MKGLTHQKRAAGRATRVQEKDQSPSADASNRQNREIIMKPQEIAYGRTQQYERRNGALHGNDVPLSAPSAGLQYVSARQMSSDDRNARASVLGPAGRVVPLDIKEVMNFPVPSEARLRLLLDLTAAEARLAQLLASGDTLEQVAQKLGVKLTTARSQLAVIFSKTGIRRQTKLVAILSRLAHLERLETQAA
jgi:DNA-binding CsgD family transcriptional regulator